MDSEHFVPQDFNSLDYARSSVRTCSRDSSLTATGALTHPALVRLFSGCCRPRAPSTSVRRLPNPTSEFLKDFPSCLSKHPRRQHESFSVSTVNTTLELITYCWNIYCCTDIVLSFCLFSPKCLSAQTRSA